MSTGPLTLDVGQPIYKNDDFTYFVPVSPDDSSPSVCQFLEAAYRDIGLIGPTGSPDAFARFDSWEGRLQIQGSGEHVSGRAVVTKCYDGRYLSVTLRKGADGSATTQWTPVPATLPVTPKAHDWLAKSFVPDPDGLFAAGQFELGEAIANLLPKESSAVHGLVVIAGTTGCSKSVIARHLISRTLAALTVGERRLRLLTLEDPIEKRLTETPDKTIVWNIDYTPRSLGRERQRGDGEPVRDCRNLAEGLRNALRMTPNAVYIGETRDQDDWREVLKFAGSGHFVVTTTHAGSLEETFKNMLRAVGAVTPADRAAVADKLVAVIHLASFPIELEWSAPSAPRGPKKATLPQVWLRTPGSSAGLVVNGLSSIQPVRANLNGAESDKTCFARVSFVRPLLKAGWNFADSDARLEDAELQVLQYELRHS